MSLNIEQASVGFFLGSILTSYLWNKRNSIFRNVKQFTCQQTRSIWTKSLKFLYNKKQAIRKDQRDDMAEQNNQMLDNQFLKRQQQKMQHIQKRKKEKKIKKQKKKAPLNLKRSIKRYQDWFLNKNSLISTQDDVSLSSQKKMIQKVDLDILKERILDYEAKLREQEEAGVNKLQQILQNEQVEQYGQVLGYNPFIEEQQSNNKQKVYQLRRISSIQ